MLYDHLNDPLENHNIVDREDLKQTVARLRKKLLENMGK